MSWRTVSRRFVVGVLGSSAAVTLLARPAMATSEVPPPEGEMGRVRALLSPLSEGSQFGRWTVVRMEPLRRGAITVTVAGADGRPFCLEVLARSHAPRTPHPPGFTERFAIYVCNGGDGWLPTCEEQGLAAMALAQVLGANEGEAELEGFLTYVERLELHHDAMMRAAAHEHS
ncbi:hypothetical protein [Chondromyces crocatus]|uniref:Secreted protein n=1 Tax=Chondromyces crocatus TaxID=52 RepID=A0A0K1E5N0_CHOCO|nr:hypothetical protein [Chondromyces crocatus]AKT36180.1 uncharacterized protein CMC5_002940 [Chondromyces crocatus]